MPKEEDLRLVYQQYWEHARHQERQRLTFTSIYGALLAGALAFIGSSISEPARLGILWGLLFVSILGFLLCHFWRIPFLWFTRLAEQMLLREFKLEKYRRFIEEETKTKFGSASAVFHFFYILTTTLFVFLLCTEYVKSFGFVNPELVSLMISLIVLLALILIYDLFFKKREKQVEKKIQDRFSSRQDLRDYLDT